MQEKTKSIMMYSRPTCPLDGPVKKALADSRATFAYIDIRANEAAKATLREINGGYESVPTLIFPDGDTLTEPSAAALEEKLLSLGFDLAPGNVQASYRRGMVRSPMTWLQIGALLAVLWAILRLIGVL